MSIDLTLALEEGSTMLTLSGEQIRVGRRPENDLVIRDGRISGSHGQFIHHESGYVFFDLDSRNGSMISRQEAAIPIPPHTPIEILEGDEIYLGDRQNPVKLIIHRIKRRVIPTVGHETIIARSSIEAPQQIEGRLAQLMFALSDEDDEMILIHRSLQTCSDQLSKMSGVGYYPLDESDEQTVSDIPLVWVSPEQISPQSPSQSFSLEALSKREVVAYYPELHGESESVSGLAGVLVAPLIIKDKAFGVLCLQSISLSFEQNDLVWVGGLSAFLAARLSSAKRISTLKASSAQLKEEKRHLNKRLSLSRPIIGESQALVESLALLERVAPTQASVLILGETGTGKELAARYVHVCSKASEGPFLAVNCGAMTDSIFQSELFGYQKGAFTGAQENRAGLFAAAQDGTLFLDELGEISMTMQVSLLRVIQEGTYSPVGSTEVLTTNARVIAATHRDLLEEVKSGRFREDLYYRIAIFPVTLPPLREREGDLPKLIHRFIEIASARHDSWVREIDESALRALCIFSWPGNIRQLEHEIERATILASDQHSIRLEHLSPMVTQGLSESARALNAQTTSAASPPLSPIEQPLKEAVSHFEQALILDRLEHFSQNRTRCAESLGISRQALQAKLAKWRSQKK